MRGPEFLANFIFLCLLLNCGGSSDGSGGQVTEGQSDDSVNTEKLVGTPFEGITSGEEVDETIFFCDPYRTEAIDSFPIQVFTALFTTSEEEELATGIEIANEATGFTVYELTDVWSDNVRVIYKVDTTPLGHFTSGVTVGLQFRFNDTTYAEQQVADWVIVVSELGVDKYILAHELGHASGLPHDLIDYENDTLLELEDNSIMSGDEGWIEPPAMTDYNYMMSMQGEIMQNYLGEIGDLVLEYCN